MNLTIHRRALLEACQLATTVVPKKLLFRSALACVCLETKGDDLVLTALGTQVGLRQTLKLADVKRPGSALMPVGELVSILKESWAELVEIELPGSTPIGETDQTVVLRLPGSLQGEFHFPQVPVEEFPAMPLPNQANLILECSALPLVKAIEQIAFAVPNRNYSSGWNLQDAVLFEFVAPHLDVVATDGHRLSASRLKCQVVQGDHSAIRTIVPDTAVYLLRDLLHKRADNDPVRISFSDSAVHFFVDTCIVCSVLLSGKFPEHRALLSQAQKKNSISATLPTDPWIAALRQIRAVADKEVRKVICDFQPNRVTLSTRGQSSGSVELEVLECSESLRIAFDFQYLIEFLTVAQKQACETVFARFATPEAAGWFSPKAEEEPEWNYLLMPMRLSES